MSTKRILKRHGLYRPSVDIMANQLAAHCKTNPKDKPAVSLLGKVRWKEAKDARESEKDWEG